MITDAIKAYRVTGYGWDALKAQLATRTYPTPERYVRPRDESDDLVPYTEGTWDEVRRCRNVGLLTDDEYLQIVREADQHRAQLPVDAKTLRSLAP